MLRKEGNLQVYEGEAEFRASFTGWKAREDHGIEFRHMNAAEMAEIQPGLSPRFTHGTFTPGWYSIADPKLYTLALADYFRASGSAIEWADIVDIRPVEGGVEVISADGRSFRARDVVLSAGAFSHRLAARLGERIPLETERGYNTTLPSDAFDLRTQITFGGVQWMGFRPSLPDTLPAIGRAKATAHVIYAFGHGHLGLTQSAGTARLVADLLSNATPPIDMKPFSPQRF